MVEPSLYATLSETAPAHRRGRMMGTGGLFQFGGSAIGASVLGALYGVREGIPFWGGGATLLLMSVLCAVAIPAHAPGTVLGGGDGGDAEAGALPLGVVEDGDDATGANVDRPLVAGELDELGPGGERREGLRDTELDGDVATVH